MGWLTKHQTSRNEIQDLLQVVECDLAEQRGSRCERRLADDVDGTELELLGRRRAGQLFQGTALEAELGLPVDSGEFVISPDLPRLVGIGFYLVRRTVLDVDGASIGIPAAFAFESFLRILDSLE
jgi:hypothetical protein